MSGKKISRKNFINKAASGIFGAAVGPGITMLYIT
jgi:hypothetical protein